MNRRMLEQWVRAMYGAFAKGDEEAYRAAFAEDVVWHVPGDNPVSGAYRGPDGYFGIMVQRMNRLDDWKLTLDNVTTNENDTAALVAFHLSGSRKGKPVDMDGHHVIRLNEKGRIVEGWGFGTGQDALDDLFSAG